MSLSSVAAGLKAVSPSIDLTAMKLDQMRRDMLRQIDRKMYEAFQGFEVRCSCGNPDCCYEQEQREARRRYDMEKRYVGYYKPRGFA